MSGPGGAPTRWRHATGGALIVALGLGLYLPGLGAEILRHPLEAKYALVAREMVRGGPLLVAHVFGELFPDKPPLFFWSVALLGWLRGGQIGELTARLPAVAAALVALLAVYRLGRDLFGDRAGLSAAAVLATTNLFFWYARQGHPDQFLIAFVTLACLGLWRAFTAGTRRDATGWTALAYAAMALGVLSKGLLGLILPLLAGTAYLAATGPLRAVPGRLRLLPGLGVFLAIVLAWFAPAVAQYGSAYLYETVIHQHVDRYTATWAHAEPWYYYLGEFPPGFLPWVLVLPGAMLLAWRARREAAEPPDAQPVLFPLAWLVTGFVFFSLSSAKRGPYLLPLYPAAALLVGWLWDRVLAGRARSGWVGVPITVMSAAAALAALALLLVPRRLIPGRTVYTVVPADPWRLAGAVVLLLAGAAVVWGLWRRGRPGATFATLVAVQGVVLLAVAIVRAPQYEAEYPVRAFAARVEAAVPPGRPLLSLEDDYKNILAFYIDRPFVFLPGPAELLAARRPGEPTYALVPGALRDGFAPAGAALLAETRLSRERVALIRVDPPGR